MKIAKRILLVIGFFLITIEIAHLAKQIITFFIVGAEYEQISSSLIALSSDEAYRELLRILIYFTFGLILVQRMKYYSSRSNWFSLSFGISGIYLMILASNGGLWGRDQIVIRLVCGLITAGLILYILQHLEHQTESETNVQG